MVLEKGCLVNSLYHYPLNMTFFSTSERLEIGGIPFMSIQAKPNRAEALEYYRRVWQAGKINVHLFEEVTEVTYQNEQKIVHTAKGIYNCGNIVLATGFYDLPNALNVPGEQLPKVSHYFHDPHYYAGQKVIVVGAHNSAADAALECYRKGAEVTMVIRDIELTDRIKYWVKPDLENRIKEGSIQAYFNSSINRITEQMVVINTPDGEQTLANDFVLAMTGYQPNFALLDRFGILFSNDGKRTPMYHPYTQESNIQGVYLAGVVCGGLDTRSWFIENSIAHAHTIMGHIKGRKSNIAV
ncbi:MAG: YpdA family putative bacillithiol disulfide reductase [Chitinophagia bacterium]|nr:YpdA family putative bacillithiol disulfide reductase [Chitinophagia bacterium]